jgi:hypothetical protein
LITRTLSIVGAFLSVAIASPALAYRPFDGTDAAVAEHGEFELELGPVGYYQVGAEHDLVLPSIVLNYGILERVELVLAGFNYLGLDVHTAPPLDRILDTEVSAKAVLREGCLQQHDGVSVATEVGVLLPQLGGEQGVGGSVAGILTKCFGRTFTVHLNGQVELTREENLDLVGGVILEGSQDGVVRPVAELYVEREFNVATTYSGLLGLIWPVNENLDGDVGFRLAATSDVGLLGPSLGSTQETPLFEIRAGITWRYR